MNENMIRIRSSVTSLSWIPSEAVTGVNKVVFGTGLTHYDDPPPDVIGDDLEAMRDADRFRFANRLSAWIDVGISTQRDSGTPSSGRSGRSRRRASASRTPARSPRSSGSLR